MLQIDTDEVSPIFANQSLELILDFGEDLHLFDCAPVDSGKTSDFLDYLPGTHHARLDVRNDFIERLKLSPEKVSDTFGFISSPLHQLVQD